MVMKNNPLNSRFEICIVRGARGENVGAKCSNLATFGPFGLNNVARDDRSAKPKASVNTYFPVLMIVNVIAKLTSTFTFKVVTLTLTLIFGAVTLRLCHG